MELIEGYYQKTRGQTNNLEDLEAQIHKEWHAAKDKKLSFREESEFSVPFRPRLTEASSSRQSVTDFPTLRHLADHSRDNMDPTEDVNLYVAEAQERGRSRRSRSQSGEHESASIGTSRSRSSGKLSYRPPGRRAEKKPEIPQCFRCESPGSYLHACKDKEDPQYGKMFLICRDCAAYLQGLFWKFEHSESNLWCRHCDCEAWFVDLDALYRTKSLYYRKSRTPCRQELAYQHVKKSTHCILMYTRHTRKF